MGAELTDLERRILAREQEWTRHAGVDDEALREALGLSAADYHRTLNALLDRPEAEAAYPMVVRRLRRRRERRRLERAARRGDEGPLAR